MFRTHRTLVLALSSLLLLPLTTACGKNSGEPKTAALTPGEMPAGGDWTGVYYDPVYGNLHIILEGDTVSGCWRKEAGDSWGELTGTVDGNLMHYEWVEHKIGMVGASAEKTGKGYFVYKESENPNEPDLVEGERGLGEDELGSKWSGLKQANVVPDCSEVLPDEVENRGVDGGGWDEGGAKPKGDADEPSVFGGGDEDDGASDDSTSGDDGDTDF